MKRLYGSEDKPTNVVYYWLRNYFRGICLDVGCGVGRYLVLMPKGSVGIDLVPPKIEGYNTIRHDLERGLPFKDEVFDCIFSITHIGTCFKSMEITA